MKCFFTILILISSPIVFGQNLNDNRSDGPIENDFNDAGVPAQLGQEIFRFKPGLVTQLNSGNGFGFSNDSWFSLGELNTGTQTVYGLRFQLPNKALTYGYQDVDDDSPRVQWIDDQTDPGDLEFRFADNFSSTNSTLVAKMTNIGQLVLPSIGSLSFSQRNDYRFSVENSSFKYGIKSRTSGFTSGEGIGVFASSSFNQSNVAVKGVASGGFILGNPPPNNIAIQGISSIGFAGFFDGDVTVTGTFTNASDRKLKQDLQVSENVLQKLAELKAYTYTFKENDNLNFDEGVQHGLIAQEVEKVYPELVHEINYPIYDDEQNFKGTDTYKSVNYIGLISELTAAIQELNTKVESLESQLETRIVYNATFTADELKKINKNAYQLEQNVPNPFSGATSIKYALPENNPKASILVFDLNGRMLKTYKLKDQEGNLKINAADLNGAGMYLYSLFAQGEEIITKRMILK